MATENDVCSLTAILSAVCDDTDTNLLYIHSIPKLYYKWIFNSTPTTWMPPSCKQTAGINVFSIQKNERSRWEQSLVKDRSRKFGSMSERFP